MPVDPQKVVLAAQMSAVAYYAILIWDWLVSLQLEWNLIWKSDWSIYKGLYLVSRYWTIFALAFSLWAYTGTISYETCSNVVNLVPASCAVIILSTECILAFRTYAIWGKQKWILAIIAPLLVGETAILIIGSITVKSALPPGISGPCLPLTKGNGRDPVFAYWLSPFIVDTIFTTLSTYKAYQLSKVGQASNILRVFVREGIFFFIVVSIANLIEMAFYLQPVAEMQGICAFLALSLSSLMCCRMVLTLRSFQTNTNVTTGRGNTAGAVSVESTELADRKHPSGRMVGDDAPTSFLRLPIPLLSKHKRGKVGGDGPNEEAGVVVSVDRLERADGAGRNTNGRKGTPGPDAAMDLEKGDPTRPSSVYSHEDQSDVSGFHVNATKRA